MTDFKNHTSDFWDNRFGEPQFRYGQEPSPYLVQQAGRLQPGLDAFVPGDGEGRNGVWLARQGLNVTTVDLSTAGVEKANSLAAQYGISIDASQADLTRWDWPIGRFDVIASFFLQFEPGPREQLHEAFLESLRPGGLIILEGFRKDQMMYRDKFGATGGPPHEEMLFSSSILQRDFTGVDEIELEEVDIDMGSDGAHSGLCALVRGVFRKPL